MNSSDYDFLPIADYAVIGDLHTAVLVGNNGSIDWCCAPRFDSPSFFGALLDRTKGGRFQIVPQSSWSSEQRYLPATNVLETTFFVEHSGVLQVTDFMPVGPSRERWTEIIRRVRCTRGTVDVEVLVQPRFDYGLLTPHASVREHGVLFADRDDDVLTVAASKEVEWSVGEGIARASMNLAADDTVWFVLRHDDDEVHSVSSYRAPDKLRKTIAYWDDWASHLRYAGPYQREVVRSALALKLCCYEPSGAIVAAATTSLPEDPGGGRNWDYRFTWLRDSAFVLYSLDCLGSETEMTSFLGFLKRVCRLSDSSHLQIMFAVDGSRNLVERELDHLEGYCGSRPARTGNGAARQFQLDIYGELLEAVDIWSRRHVVSEGLWKVVCDLVDWTAANWHKPDYSIWEARQEPKHYVFSKVMAWTALDRGVRIARRHKLDGNIQQWATEAAKLRAEILEKGWDPVRKTLVQAYGEPQLDAAVLVIPMVRFMRRNDPRLRSTLEAVRHELATSAEELIYRYRSADGLSGDEGAFLFSSFWMVQNLAIIGDHAEAERLFKLLLRRANHVGLFAEEIDPATGAQLGNFPQALSHSALINTAFTLENLRPRVTTGRRKSDRKGKS